MNNDDLKDNDDDNKMSKVDEVKKWMKETVDLEQYTDLLINNGYDDMESISDLTMNELKDIGVEKIGHRKKIFKHAQNIYVLK